MKIGILTFHKAHNYGAVLQAVALRNKLVNLGHKVFFIDYWPEYHSEEYALFRKDIFGNLSILGKINFLKNFVLNYSKNKNRRDIFEKFIDTHITPFSVSGKEEKFDAIIYGSDQIWRKMSKLKNQFDEVYFGHHSYNTDFHMAYAASMGNIDLSDTDSLFLKNSLVRFKKVGVREVDLLQILNEMKVKNTYQCIDPTLLLTKEDWRNILRIQSYQYPKPYLLFYDLMKGSFDLAAVKEFAKAKNLELIILKGRIDRENYNCKTIDVAGPQEFISLIAGASFVLTSSFHGLAFSIIFKKQFLASYRTNSGRAKTLLDTLSLKERLLNPRLSKLPILKEIDYASVSPQINSYKTQSLDFLNSIKDVH